MSVEKSYKNLLQEFCQKEKLSLPKYVSAKNENDTMWLSTVFIETIEPFFSGESLTKKVVAEQMAAQRMLEFLEKKDDKNGKKLCNDHDFSDTVILVDLENSPQILDVLEKIPKSVNMIGVVGHCHPLASKNIPIQKNVIRDATKDAADHALTFLAGKMSSELKGKNVYILSRDHYAQITVKCLEDCGVNARHVAHVNELFSL